MFMCPCDDVLMCYVSISPCVYRTNTKCWTNVGLMLSQSRRRWTSFNTTLTVSCVLVMYSCGDVFILVGVVLRS